jgi:hypothetical protein
VVHLRHEKEKRFALQQLPPPKSADRDEHEQHHHLGQLDRLMLLDRRMRDPYPAAGAGN